MKTTSVYSLKLIKDRSIRFPIREVGEPSEAAALVFKLIADAPSEHMVAIFVDAKNEVIGTTIAVSGGSHGMQVSPKDLFRAAIVANAAGIVLGHNHPSGDPRPSVDDLATTQKLVDVGKLLGVTVLDHVVVAMDRAVWSMFAHGQMPS